MAQKRRNPPARYQLPLVVNPASHKCFVIQVPNDIYHLAAFRGQLEALASAYAWGNDEAHTALSVASVWRNVIDNMESCMPAPQFRQNTNCTLQVSFDGGFTWDTVFNAYNCALGAIADEIANGTLQAAGVSQSPAGGVIPVNECHSYHVVLFGNQRWHSPIPLSDGYSITVSNVKGGWSDGYALGAVWQCPDGEYYSLGYCTGSFIGGYAGDPIPSLYHMRLIGHVGVYFDAYNTSYVVPNGTGNADLVFQANDSDLSDNLGSIEFDVAICNYSSWCYEFDFRVGTQGFANYTSTATWVNGQGWQNTGGDSAIYISRLFASAYITYIEYEIDISGSSSPPWRGFNAGAFDGSTTIVNAVNTSYGNGNHVNSASGGGNATIIKTAMQTDGVLYLRRIRIHGSGVNPFGSSNC